MPAAAVETSSVYSPVVKTPVLEIWPYPFGYTSDTALSDSASYDNQTFSSLGLTDGTYEWTWGTGADQNFTLIIGGTFIPAPEPSALALLGTALTGLFLLGARRRRI